MRAKDVKSHSVQIKIPAEEEAIKAAAKKYDVADLSFSNLCRWALGNSLGIDLPSLERGNPNAADVSHLGGAARWGKKPATKPRKKAKKSGA
jgi:hypothetical protein